MALDLKLGTKIGFQLTDGVDGSPADTGVGVGELRQNLVDNVADLGSHLLLAPLSDLRNGNEASVSVLPVGVVQEERDQLRVEGNGSQSAPTERGRQTVEHVLANIKVGLLSVLFLIVASVPLSQVLIFDAQHQLKSEWHHGLSEPLALSHHARRAFCHCDQKLGSEMASVVFQARGSHELKHHLEDRCQQRAEEMGQIISNVQQLLEDVASAVLVLLVESHCQHLHHGGQKLLQLSALGFVVADGHDQRGARLESSQTNLGGPLISHCGREKLPQRGHACTQLVADNKAQLGENEESTLTMGSCRRPGELEKERQDLRPLLDTFIQHHRCDFTDSVSDLLPHSVLHLVLDSSKKLSLHVSLD
mmetsp:Transcript_7590/g.17418  ORF Transcript_7590/g.17418 Transcript_7590/m.17418 type:complete len:363 (-) Transcript_7590:251-1339(-)